MLTEGCRDNSTLNSYGMKHFILRSHSVFPTAVLAYIEYEEMCKQLSPIHLFTLYIQSFHRNPVYIWTGRS